MFNFFRQLFKREFSLKFNVLANFIGNIWTALMSIAFVPIYLHYVGIEAFGLIGIFASVQAAIWMMDMGIGATLTRELARLSAFPDKSQEMRDMVRTVELIYLGMAFVICLLMILIAYFLANYWLKPEKLSVDTIEHAFIILSIASSFQWLWGFYNGCLLGLQKQVLLSVLNVIFATLRSFGAIIVLIYVAPTIEAFLIWQALINLIQAFVFFIALLRNLPKTERAGRFRLILLRRIFGFATGLTTISVLTLILTQADKVILSRFLSLEDFGYYAFATTIAAGLSRLVKPIFESFYPRLSQLVAIGSKKELARVYHQGTQVMGIMIVPLALVFGFFSYEILFLWTQNVEKAANTYIILALLMIGNLFNGLYNLPYALQLAYGETKLQITATLIFVCLFIPLMFFIAPYYGAIGVASLLILLNLLYILVVVNIMHQDYLRREKWRWYFGDVGAIIFSSLLVVVTARLLIQSNLTNLENFIALSVISILTFASAILSASYMRTFLFKFFAERKREY